MKYLILLNWFIVFAISSNCYAKDYRNKNLQTLKLTSLDSPIAYINAAILKVAYNHIGVGINVYSNSGKQALRETLRGKADGHINLSDSNADISSKLIKIDVPLHPGNLIASSLVPLNYKTWNEFEKHSICYPYGMMIVENNTNGFYKIPVKSHEECYTLITKGQIDVMFSPDLSIKLINMRQNKKLFPVEHMSIPYKTYHYLHIKNQDLAESITQNLKEMIQNKSFELISNLAIKQMKKRVSMGKEPYCLNTKPECFGWLEEVYYKTSK